MRRRFLSLNLALLMLFTMLPLGAVPASAADSDNGYAVYYKNDGTDESVSDVVGVFLTSNAALKLYEAMPAFTAENKAVTSYNSAADGGGTSYALSSTLRESYTTDSGAPGTLYAQWEDAPGNHILYISTDGLSAGGEDYVLDSGLPGTVTLRGEDTFSPAGGGKVIGWATTPRYYGANDVYTINSDVEILGDLTLYSISGVNYITFHYDEYDYTSDQPKSVETTRFYQQNDDLIDSYNIERSIYVDNGIFVGWNERADGTGSWYNSDDEAGVAPNDLYAQYETYPSQSEYCVLTTSSHPFANGKQSMILPLTDGKAILPLTLADGKIAAYYWSWGTGSGEIYYPSGEEVEIEHRANLTAVAVNPSSYYGIINGDGGQTASGSKYSATSCFVTSAGNLNIYSFNDVATFTKDGQAVSGYKGEKTGAVYGVDDDIWAAMGTEAGANQIANFTAQYQAVTGGYVQYFGNGAQTSGGASYIIQDGLDFAALGDATFAANPFIAPAGQSFIGWNTQADGRGDWYDAGSAITVGENTVLYAQWGENRITYHFYGYRGDSTITEINEEIISPSISIESDAFDGLIEKTANQYRLLQYASFDRLGDSITRLDAIKLIVALGGMNVDTSGSVTLPFDDCDDLTDLEKAIVKAAVDAGIELGTGQNRFDPNNRLTREQMASLIWRTIDEPSASAIKTYSDVESNRWSYELVTALLNLGILPSGTNTFSPVDPLTGRDALRWAITAYEWKQDGGVKSSGLLEDNYDLLLFEGWNTAPDGSGTWYCTGSDVPAGSVLHLYESWILPPATGYYYVLLAPELDNGRMAKVVTMSAETESVTLPNSGQLGWASGTVQEAGFLDDERSIHLPGTTVEAVSGTQFRSLKPYTYAEFHENYSGHQEQRVYYNLVSNGRLSLYGPSDIFSDLPTGVTFKHWNTTANGSGIAYMEGQNLSDGTYLLYAQWQSSGQPVTPPVNPGGGDDDDGGGDGGGGGYAPGSPSTQNITVPISGEDNTIHVGATVKGNTATINNVDLSQLNTVIGDHVEEIDTVTIDFSGLDKDINTVTLPADVVKQISNAVSDPNNDAQSLLIVLSDGTSIEFDAAALGEKSAQADGQDITISIKPAKDANPNRKQEAALNGRPAYEITVTSGGEHISYMGGKITVHAPYKLQDGERPNGIIVWFVDEDGNKERCWTSYDEKNEVVNFQTDHLSLYMIDYDPDYIANCPRDESCPMYPFTDLDVGAWYHDGVHYAIENGLMNGTSTAEMLFSPNGTTTRAQIVTILHRLEGSPINGQGKSGTFVDVPEYQWYTEAVEWAAANGITSGTGDGTTFSPNDPITREQLATFLWRYAQCKHYDVSVGEDTNILSYEDAFTVSEYAISAMQWACGAGIIGGIEKDGSMYLDPQGSATRAQAATMLMRFGEQVK